MAAEDQVGDYGISWKKTLAPPRGRLLSGNDVGEKQHLSVYGNKVRRINFFIENDQR